MYSQSIAVISLLSMSTEGKWLINRSMFNTSGRNTPPFCLVASQHHPHRLGSVPVNEPLRLFRFLGPVCVLYWLHSLSLFLRASLLLNTCQHNSHCCSTYWPFKEHQMVLIVMWPPRAFRPLMVCFPSAPSQPVNVQVNHRSDTYNNNRQMLTVPFPGWCPTHTHWWCLGRRPTNLLTCSSC